MYKIEYSLISNYDLKIIFLSFSNYTLQLKFQNIREKRKIFKLLKQIIHNINFTILYVKGDLEYYRDLSKYLINIRKNNLNIDFIQKNY